MAGEQWKRLYQIGKEVTPGTPVAATRKLYGTGALTRDRAIHMVEVQTGNRAMNVGGKVRAVVAGGQMVQPLSADEIVEPLLMSVQGGVTPTTVDTTGKQWLFKATGATIDTATLEFYDGERNWQQTGVNVDTLSIAGSVEADNTVTATFFGREMVVNAQTPALTDRQIDIIEGWESQLFIDALGATPGTTNIPGTMISWKIDFSNNLGRKYFADNTTATGAVILGKLGLKAEIVMEADAAALTEYTNRETAVQRLVRFQFGNNILVGSTTAKKKVAIDMPCLAGAIDLTGVTNGTATYKFNFEYMNDATNGFPLQVTVVNSRATAY